MASLFEDERVRELLGQLPLLKKWQALSAEKSGQQRAFIVEFAGMPKAGKSSAIENLRHFFSYGQKDPRSPEFKSPRRGYRIYTPAEGVSLRTPSELGSDKVDFNTWAGAYALQELIRALHDPRNDLVILDRGPWDAGCWLEYWKDKLERNSFAPQDVAQIQNFFHLSSWMTRSDLHVLLTVDPAQARKRERDSRLVEHGGFASNLKGMKALREIYEWRFEELLNIKARECPHVAQLGALMIDTTDLSQREVALQIMEQAMAVLSAKIEHYAGQFVFSSEWIYERIGGYLPKVRGKKKDVLPFLRRFVDRANDLPPDKRIALKQLIDDAQVPDGLLISARASAEGKTNKIEAALNELLEQVRQR